MKYIVRTISNCKIDTQWTFDTREKATNALHDLYELLKHYYNGSDYSRLGDWEGGGFQVMEFDLDKMAFVCCRRYDIYTEE